MTYTIYGAMGSGSVPVEAALTLIGAPYKVIEAVTWESEAERDKVAPVNPMRQIPVLITPEGETLTECAAILIWLAEQHPEAALAPEPGDPRRAQFLRWMSFVPAAVYSMFWVRDDPSRLAGDDPVAQKMIKVRTAERIADCWEKMEGQLTPGPFLLGAELTVLDLYVAVASRWKPHRQRFHQVAPRMGEVMRRVDALPELKELWAQRFPLVGRYAG